MTSGDLLTLLEGIRRTRSGWMAKCPSHTDKNPSLSIREGEDQRLLLYYFGGCTTRDICVALRLSLADLFPVNDKSSHQIRHECRQRQAARAAHAQEQHARGLTLDVVREAERFIHSARGILDSHTWSPAKRHRIMNRLADAYEVLRREGVLYEPTGNLWSLSLFPGGASQAQWSGHCRPPRKSWIGSRTCLPFEYAQTR